MPTMPWICGRGAGWMNEQQNVERELEGELIPKELMGVSVVLKAHEACCFLNGHYISSNCPNFHTRDTKTEEAK